jgi:hypothetical protein
MYVQNRLRKRREEGRADHSHVAGETHEANVARVQLSCDGPLVVIARRCRPMVDAERLDAGAPSDLQASGLGAIRDHDGNNGIQPPVADGADQRLKIAAPAGDEDAKTTVHSRFT